MIKYSTLNFFSTYQKLILTNHVTHFIDYVSKCGSSFVLISPRGQFFVLLFCVLGGSAPVACLCILPTTAAQGLQHSLAVHSKGHMSLRLRLIGPGTCISCITSEVIPNYFLRALKFHNLLILGFLKGILETYMDIKYLQFEILATILPCSNHLY